MTKGLFATATITINAPLSTVWNTLVNPETIKQYMFGTTVVTDWKVGSDILWKGEWQGKPYEDKGKIIAFESEKVLEVTHYSPLSGVPDIPENYHTLRYELTSDGSKTTLTLTQDNNATEDEKEHSEKNWNMMLQSIQNILESD